MDGNETSLAKLAAPHGEQAAPQVDVVPVERERLGNAQARDSKEAEERGVGWPAQPQRRREPGGLPDERSDLLVAVDVGRVTAVAGHEKPRGRHLGAGLGRTQPAREAAHVAEARRPGGGRGRARRPCPAQRELGRDDGRPLPVGELDEAPQQEGGPAEFGAEAAPQREVVGEGRGEGAHRAPLAVGQGRATSRRASKSSLA